MGVGGGVVGLWGGGEERDRWVTKASRPGICPTARKRASALLLQAGVVKACKRSSVVREGKRAGGGRG